MKVLVTGGNGDVGRALTAHLRASGDEVVDYDIADGLDVLDYPALREAAAGCDATAHLAMVHDTVPRGPFEHRRQGPPEMVLAVGIVGTLNVLQAAAAAGQNRVVMASSVNALGLFMDQRPPDYLPIDNAHPAYPRMPYSLAKLTSERVCASFTAHTGMTTVCLRLPAVFGEERLRRQRRNAKRWVARRRAYWEYGAYIAMGDATELFRCAVHSPFKGHAALLASADDAALGAQQTSREAASTVHPDVPWRGGPEFDRDPFRTLVDNAEAKRLLGWVPKLRFRE